MRRDEPRCSEVLVELVEAGLERAQAVDVDEDVVEWSLFDFATCAIAGLPRLPATWELSEAGRLAVAAHIHDRDDIHWESLTHPGGVIWPAALVIARDTGASGEALVRAVALGHEVMTRLSRVLGPSHRQYWHSTTTCGAAGVAAAAASLMTGDVRSIADAVGHATSIAGGSARALFERSGTRLFHRAHAVDAGISAARAAAAGVSATRFGLEHENGVLAALRADGEKHALSERGASVVLRDVSPRLLAATGWAHAACAAADALGPLGPEAVETIEVAVSAAAIALAGNPNPQDQDEAWWSIPHAVSVVVVSGSCDGLEAGFSHQPAVTEVMERLSLSATQPDVSARVRVRLRGRASAVVAERWPPGHPRSPATIDDRMKKWRSLVGDNGEGEVAEISSQLGARGGSPAISILELIDKHATAGASVPS
jgi:2-methylcitrate dehydratase PrpD